jgi:hypothetical protein
LTLVAADGGDPIQGQATYVPAPGTPSTKSPALTAPSDARGVYQLEDVTFPVGDLGGAAVVHRRRSAHRSHHPVRRRRQASLPAPGQPALKTVNLTMADKGNPQAIDSRAQDGTPVPDPELHQDTIAGAIADHRAALALFATPVYCQSQFCGPTTDALEQLADRPQDRGLHPCRDLERLPIQHREQGRRRLAAAQRGHHRAVAVPDRTGWHDHRSLGPLFDPAKSGPNSSRWPGERTASRRPRSRAFRPADAAAFACTRGPARHGSRSGSWH